jgi:signal transduction histidine kinase/CheY-like chemotaxis protein
VVKIRSQLAALMLAVVAPVALLAALAIVGWYEAQREVHSQRYLERVRALRLALDTEIQGNVRVLKIFARRDALSMPQAPAPKALDDSLRRMLQHNPRWTSIAIVETDGTRSAYLGRNEAGEGDRPDPATLAQVYGTGRPAVSGLVTSPDGANHYTHIAVPALQTDQVTRVVVVAIHHAGWLRFLRAYPIAEDATLTLNDAAGRIIARTLNHEQWVGKTSRSDYLVRARARTEDSFVNAGLEGQRFYTAFSRLEDAPWTLGTGVPAAAVEAVTDRQALLVAAGVLVTALAALIMAVLLGRRITQAFTGLAELLPMSDAEREQVVQRALPITEADDVRRLLRETLQARAEALAAAETARMQAESANRAKDEFVAMLAHELRNPLSAMAASVSLLESPRATAQTDLQARQVLKRQVNQATMLVDDLLDTARINTGQIALRLGEVDLAQVAATAAHGFVQACAARNQELSLDLQRALVHGDAARLEQVVANLLHNAVKFTSPGGRIRLQVHADDGTATLRVSDDGIGIPPERLPQVFEPYTQVDAGIDRARGGLGLGLHLVKQLVTMQGGQVSAHSDGVGKGTVFEVRLPLRGGVPGVAPAAQEVAPPQPLHVVLVEDNADVRDAVARLLRAAGHQVHCAERGDDGLELILRKSPDVALVDVGLPGMNGFDIARRLRAEPDRPHGSLLLALTAYGDDETRARAIDAGFDALLLKPFDLNTFNRLLQGQGPQRPRLKA